MCAKDCCKKHLAFEKREHFENGQNWTQHQGLWKMISLGQKLQMPKWWAIRLYDYIRVDVCKRPVQKTPNIGKMREF